MMLQYTGLTELLNLRSVTFKGNNDGDTIFGGLIARGSCMMQD